MPLEYLIPTATNVDTFSAGTVGAATRHEACDDPWGTPDDVTSYIQHDCATGAGEVRFGMSDLAAYVVGVTSVAMKARVREIDANPQNCNVAQYLAGNVQGTVVATTGAYANIVTSSYTTKPGGGAWTVSDANSSEGRVIFAAAGAAARHELTQVGFEVDAVWSSGGLIFLIGVLGPLVAVGLHEMPKVAAAVYAHTRTLIKPDEYLAAWQALRDGRYARHFLLGAR